MTTASTRLPTETSLVSAGMHLRIDVWTDVECPWCYIGKHRLDEAIAASPHAAAITVKLHSYQLDPDLSDQPIPNVDLVAAKYRLPQAEAARIDGKVAAIAHREGLPFVADRVLANSFDLHRVLYLADRTGLAYELLGVLQRTLFSGEANIFDHTVLAKIASQVGIPPTRVEHVLESDEYADAVRADLTQARELGITAIPYTVFGGRLAIAGSTSVDGFADAIQKAWDNK